MFYTLPTAPWARLKAPHFPRKLRFTCVQNDHALLQICFTFFFTLPFLSTGSALGSGPACDLLAPRNNWINIQCMYVPSLAGSEEHINESLDLKSYKSFSPGLYVSPKKKSFIPHLCPENAPVYSACSVIRKITSVLPIRSDQIKWVNVYFHGSQLERSSTAPKRNHFTMSFSSFTKISTQHVALSHCRFAAGNL